MLITKKIKLSTSEIPISGHEDDHYFMSCPYDFSEHDFLFQLLVQIGCSPKTIIDAGANIGLFSLCAHVVFPKAQIYAFEPNPETFLALDKNEDLAEGKIFPLMKALGEKEETLRFHTGGPINSKRSSGSHIMNEAHWKKENSGISIKCSTIDNEVDKNGMNSVDLIKIDVEGFELDVLKGAVKTIVNNDPIIYLEFNSWAIIALKNLNPRDFLEYLRANFSLIYRVNNDNTLSPLKTHEDCIRFLHDNLLKHGCVNDLIVCKERNPFIELPDSYYSPL